MSFKFKPGDLVRLASSFSSLSSIPLYNQNPAAGMAGILRDVELLVLRYVYCNSVFIVLSSGVNDAGPLLDSQNEWLWVATCDTGTCGWVHHSWLEETVLA